MNPVTQKPRSDQAPEVAAPAMRADARRNRAKIVKAAKACLARDGLDAQIDDIAHRAKVGVGTVYRHFPTKDDLVVALCADRFERLAELAQKALEDPDPWHGFCEFVRASAGIQVADRALSEVMLDRSDVMREHAERVDLLGLVGELMKRAKKTGDLRKDAEPEDVPMLICALGGAAEMKMMDWERYLGIAIDGLRAPGTSRLPKRPS